MDLQRKFAFYLREAALLCKEIVRPFKALQLLRAIAPHYLLNLPDSRTSSIQLYEKRLTSIQKRRRCQRSPNKTYSTHREHLESREEKLTGLRQGCLGHLCKRPYTTTSSTWPRSFEVRPTPLFCIHLLRLLILIRSGTPAAVLDRICGLARPVSSCREANGTRTTPCASVAALSSAQIEHKHFCTPPRYSLSALSLYHCISLTIHRGALTLAS